MSYLFIGLCLYFILALFEEKGFFEQNKIALFYGFLITVFFWPVILILALMFKVLGKKND